MSPGAPQHDNSYKLLFSHPQMVEDLLRGFVGEEWISEVDFSTLEYPGEDERHPLDRVNVDSPKKKKGYPLFC